MGSNELRNVKALQLVDAGGDVNLTVNGSGDLVVSEGLVADSLESTGDLTVGGNASITGNMGVFGNVGISGALGVNGETTVGSFRILGTDYVITSTGDANMNTVEAANGLTVGKANALTSTVAGQLDMGANDLTNIKSITTTGDATIGGDLNVTGASNLNDTNVTGNFTITDSADPTKSVTMDVRVATVDGTGYDVLQVNGDMLTDGVVGSTEGFSVLKANGVDTYDTVFRVDENGSITSDVFSTDVTGNTVTIGKADDTTATTVKGTLEVTKAATLDDALTVAGVTTLSDTNGLQFGATGQNVTAIDDGAAPVATKDATTLATIASVLTSAENADYTGTGPNINTTYGTSPTTINGAIDTLDTLLGDVKTQAVNGSSATDLTTALNDLNTNMNNVLGAVYKADGTYDNTQLAGDGFVAGKANLTASLLDYAANVEGATGGTFAADGTWSASVNNAFTTGVDYTYATAANDLMEAVDQIATNLGTAADLSAGTAGAANNGVATTNTVNKNISFLNASVGDVSTLANANNNLQDALGTKANTVVAALDDLDASIGDRTAIGSLNTNINTETAKSVAKGLKAAGDAIGDMNFASAHYVSGTTDLSESVRVLDNNLYRVESDLKDLKKEFKNGMASLSAMSALVPNPRATGNTSLSVGTGMYDGHTAVAFGGFHHLTDNIMLNAGAAWGNANDLTYRMGITWSW